MNPTTGWLISIVAQVITTILSIAVAAWRIGADLHTRITSLEAKWDAAPKAYSTEVVDSYKRESDAVHQTLHKRIDAVEWRVVRLEEHCKSVVESK